MEELEALEHAMNGEDLHKLGMKMWLFQGDHDEPDTLRDRGSFKFVLSHGDSSDAHKIMKKMIFCVNGDTLETAEMKFDLDKMHKVMAMVFHYIDEMDFNITVHDSMKFEHHIFSEEDIERKLKLMEQHIEQAVSNFQFQFEVNDDSTRKDCRVIVKSFPDNMEHIEKMMEDILVEIKIAAEEEVDDGEAKMVKHIIKVYTNDEEVEVIVAPNNQLDIENLTVYPNPSDGKFRIEFELPSKGQTEVEIKDIKGGIVFRDKFKNPKEGAYSREVNLEGSAKGVYILTIKQGKKLANKRLIIR